MIPFTLIYHHKGAQRIPWHSNATREGGTKNKCKRVLFKANFAVFWAQKEVVWASKWLQNTLDGDLRCLFII